MPTKKKPTQLDRIENRLGLIESSLAVLRSGTTFMQELDRAAVTAKEIGLVPVEEKLLKVGDLVAWCADRPEVTNPPSGVLTVTKTGELNFTGRKYVDVTDSEGIVWSFWAEDFRRLSEAEIAAHLAEQEARKPVVFGTRVECRGKTYRIIADKPDHLGFYPMYCNNARSVFHAKRNEFTVIDPQP